MGVPDSRPDVREEASGLGNLESDFDFCQAPRPPLLLPTHPAPGAGVQTVPRRARWGPARPRLRCTPCPAPPGSPPTTSSPPAPASSTTAAASAAPVLELTASVAPRQDLRLHQGRVYLQVGCDVACTLDAHGHLNLLRHRRHLGLRRVQTTLEPDHTVQIALALSPANLAAARRALGAHHTVKSSIEVQADPPTRSTAQQPRPTTSLSPSPGGEGGGWVPSGACANMCSYNVATSYCHGSRARNNYCPASGGRLVLRHASLGPPTSETDIAVTAPRLPQVEALVERLADSISGQDPRSDAAWLVEGVATAGKSTTLRMLADALRGRDQIAVLCAPPAHALDAGPMALAELAAGLKDAGCVNGQTEILRDGTVPLAEKIKRVREWVIASQDSIVLLLDEPSAWPDRFEQTEHFADHARLVVAELVRDIPCRRVLTGDAPEGMPFLARQVVGESSEPQIFLTDRDAWGDLAQAASDLQEGAGQGLRISRPCSCACSSPWSTSVRSSRSRRSSRWKADRDVPFRGASSWR